MSARRASPSEGRTFRKVSSTVLDSHTKYPDEGSEWTRKRVLPQQLPSEVWAITFDYVGHVPPLRMGWRFSQLRLLSTSFTAGLDEWIMQGIDRRLKKDGALVLAAPKGDSSVRLTSSTMIQKRLLLSLSKAPTEVLMFVTALGWRFLSTQFPLCGRSQKRSRSRTTEREIISDVLYKLQRVTCIEGPFLKCNVWLRKVDLSAMNRLTTIGSDFLNCSCIEHVLLPRSLESVEDNFLTNSSVEKVNLAETCLRFVGHQFLSQVVAFEWRLRLPATLTEVGAYFLSGSSFEVVDLSKTALESAKDGFLMQAFADELLPPRNLKKVGDFALQESFFENLDLSVTRLEVVGKCFLAGSKTKALRLPPTLKSAGHYFLAGSSIKVVNLFDTCIESLWRCPLAGACFEELVLPPSLTEVEDTFLSETFCRKVDLSHTGLQIIPQSFLSGWKMDQVLLPKSLERVEGYFLAGSSVKSINLPDTSLNRVGPMFLSHAELDELRLPPSLTEVDYCFGLASIFKKVDLSQTRLTFIGNCFLWNSVLDEVLLPKSLARVGDFFLAGSTVKKLDLSETSLTQADSVGHDFLEGATIDELRLPLSFGSFWVAGCSRPPVRRVVLVPSPQSAGQSRKRSRHAADREDSNSPPPDWGLQTPTSPDAEYLEE